MFFVVEFIFNISIDEHDPIMEGNWTLMKSLVKQIKGRLLIDLLAIIPFP